MSSASRLQHRVVFAKRELIDDGYGNQVSGPWTAFHTAFAEFRQPRAREQVMANALSGSTLLVMRVRASASTHLISTDCKATHKGVDHNIRGITATEDRKWLDILAESGVAV